MDTPMSRVLTKAKKYEIIDTVGIHMNLLHAARIDTPVFDLFFPGKGAPMTPVTLWGRGTTCAGGGAAPVLQSATCG